ncbi:MAG: thiamine pyrophosphate-binding protein [Thermodesulfobacteriota bacterium]
MDLKTGGQLAAQALENQGVDHIFTLSGGHITPIYQYLENSKIRLFDTRHEQAAVFMAEAWGRLTRRPGVALVTAGPGFTNALTPIASARLANTPLVLISGCVGLEMMEKLDLQDMPQAPVIAPLVKKALVCHRPERIEEFVDLAFRTAAHGRPGPVYLELPVDVLNARLDGQTVKRPRTRLESKPVDFEKARLIIERLERAERPVVIAGSGAWYGDAGRDLTLLAEKAGLPVFTSALGRGAIGDDHPLCFGGSLAIRPGAAFFAIAGADLVLLLGNRLGLFYIFGDLFNPQAKLIQVDLEPEEIGRNRTIDLPVFSDAGAMARELVRLVDEKALGSKLTARFADWVAALRQADRSGRAEAKANWESAAIPIHPLRLAREVNDFMSREDDVVVADGGDTSVWMGMTRTVRRPGRYLDSGLFGCLGAGLPNALAAQLLYPGQRVCVVTGDGSIGFNFMEFETALRKKMPVVVVISNDLGWGMIRHSQEIRIGHAINDGTWLGRVDYHRLVEAMGGLGLLVERPEDIRPALEAAFASGRTACVNVMTDPTTISPGSIALANLGAYKAD